MGGLDDLQRALPSPCTWATAYRDIGIEIDEALAGG